MIANLLIIVFILLAALWFSNQGLFSALLHLIVTLCAGALAFAFWEPLTIGFLIDRMPELAWGVGLLVPFIAALLLIRVVLDMLVPGNVQFHNLVDMIGGGGVGILSAILAGGVLMIGLQFISGFDIGGYKPYSISVNGKPERTETLWVPVDQMAGTMLTQLSGGPFLPWSGKSLGVYQPNVVERAGVFQLNSRTGARNAIRPANVELTGYFELPTNELPEAARTADRIQTVVVSTNIQLVAAGDTAGAADVDGSFTASRPQVGLIAVSKTDPDDARLIYAHGYVVGKEFGTLVSPQEFARSFPAVDKQSFDWLFALPENYQPHRMVLKQLRLELPDEPKLTSEVDTWLTNTRWESEVEENGTGSENTNIRPSNGTATGVEGLKIEVSDQLPRSLNKNSVVSNATGASFGEKNALIRARGTVRITNNIGPNLSVDRIEHPANTEIVRLQLTPKKAQSLYGRALEMAAQLAPPVLTADNGASYRAIGWVRESSAELELQVDTANPISRMTEVKVADLKENEKLYLYFRTGKGIRVTSFEIGQTKQDVDLVVPR